jgi:hypothetical protein
MILAPEQPDDEDLENEKFVQILILISQNLDFWSSTKRQQTFTGLFTRGLSYHLKDWQ